MIVITRHQALVEFLKNLGVLSENCKVITHAGPEDVAGQVVFGVLPHRLSCLTSQYWEVELDIPAEKRGQELSLEEVEKYFQGLHRYEVKKVTSEDF